LAGFGTLSDFKEPARTIDRHTRSDADFTFYRDRAANLLDHAVAADRSRVANGCRRIEKARRRFPGAGLIAAMLAGGRLVLEQRCATRPNRHRPAPVPDPIGDDLLVQYSDALVIRP
jgi:hypothetical protein